MCGSSKSTTSNTQQQSGTSTSTPNVNSWLDGRIRGVTDLLGSLDYSQFNPGRSSALQDTASANASGLTGVGAPAISSAIGSLSSLPGVASINGAMIDPNDIQRLMNPELQDVVDTTLAGFDRDAGQKQAALDAQSGLNSGAFGSSGFALNKSNLTGLNSLNRASTEATLRSQAYNDAAGLAAGDAQREQEASLANQSTSLQSLAQRIQAAMGVGSLGSQQNANAVSDVNTQAGLGATLQQQDTAAKQFPLQYQEMLAALYQSLMPGYTGQTVNSSGTSSGTGTTTSTPSFLQQLMMLSQMGVNGAKMAAGG